MTTRLGDIKGDGRVDILLGLVLLGLLLSIPTWKSATGQEPSGSEPPNIIILLVDDMGFADIGSYGSEVATPNLDALAAEGVRFSNFHTAATCSPTRSMLLTGVANHLIGFGNMIEIMAHNQFGQPWIRANPSLDPLRSDPRYDDLLRRIGFPES